MSIKVCQKIRAQRNKVFKGLARSGKSSMGWFFSFKIHVVINDVGEIIELALSSGTVHDTKMMESLSTNIFGYLFGDKGYLSKVLAQKLQENNDITLITNVRSNMKPIHTTSFETSILSKRFLIEIVFGTLKSSTNIEHSRHRSPQDFLLNLFSSLVSYNTWTQKPKYQ